MPAVGNISKFWLISINGEIVFWQEYDLASVHITVSIETKYLL